MRALAMILCSLLLTLVGLAQSRQANVVLDDGRVLRGNVLELDQGHMTLEVDGKPVRLTASQIRRCHFLKDEPNKAEEANAAPLEEPAPAPERAVKNKSKARRTPPAQLPESATLGQQRLQAIQLHYPWLAPAEATQWVSLGFSLLLLLTLVVHFAGKVGGADRPSMLSSCVGGGFFLVVIVTQISLVPITGANVLAMAVGNVVAGTLAFRLLHRMSASTACLAFFILLAELGICFGILEGIEMTLRMANGEFSGG